jgi:hypothetical protein
MNWNTAAIVNLANGAWYPRGQARLLQSLKDVGFPGRVFAYSDPAQVGAPPHNERPYAFKIEALKRARQEGCDLVLWADAAVWAVKPLDGLFEHIEREGHVFFHSGFNVAQWSSDSALRWFGITRDQAEQMVMLFACCFGLNLANERSVEFLTRLDESQETFPGSWTNDQHQVSQDPRCAGHRHDQTAASIIAAQLGMEVIVGHTTFFQYYANPGSTAFVYGGQNDNSLMNPEPVLWTQGM